jgi:hypothetical protein
MKIQRVDYTHTRRGQKSVRGHQLTTCPQCGRRGEYDAGASRQGRYVPDRYIHKGELSLNGQTALFEPTDVCFIRLELTPAARQVLAAIREFDNQETGAAS